MTAKSASSTSHVDAVELYFERDDVGGKERELEAALLRQEGVSDSAVVPHGGPSVEVCLRVRFDPTVTNPVILKEALARDGFTVLSASEQPAAAERTEATR